MLNRKENRLNSTSRLPKMALVAALALAAALGAHVLLASYEEYAAEAQSVTTADATPPTIIEVSPANAATGVARSHNVVATFSEDMNQSTVVTDQIALTSSTVQLYQKYRYQVRKKVRGKIRRVWRYRWVPVSAKVSYDAATKAVTLDPSSDLSANTNYLTIVTTGVRDEAGNALAQNYTWTFTTDGSFGSAVLVGAGDIASCSSTGDEATANLLDGIEGTVFTTGDNVYNSGTDAEFNNCYEPSWGRHKGRTYPTPGNHEYNTANASGYFNYFGAVAGEPSKGYYSYNLGDWHIVSLNSMCENVGGCGDASPMLTWLKNDLAANPKSCTLAYWHHPLFSSGPHGNQTKMRPTWDILYTADVDVVLNGHDHDYERFAPQDPGGVADSARGIREFVVGTGGKTHYSFGAVKSNSEVRNSDTYGVLKLSLNSGNYAWEFVPEAGKTFTDSGSTNCH